MGLFSFSPVNEDCGPSLRSYQFYPLDQNGFKNKNISILPFGSKWILKNGASGIFILDCLFL